MEPQATPARRWRLIAVLALGAVIGMMLVAQPAGAHFLASIDHIWHHIKPKADERYLPSSGNLKPGKTLRGVYWALGDDDTNAGHIASSEISFQVPLASAPNVHYIASGDPVPTQCRGTAANPGAKPGNLCVFQLSGYNATGTILSSPDDFSDSTRFGAVVLTFSAGAGRFSNGGTWAVTAPNSPSPKPVVSSRPHSRSH